ncbi:MAG: hypothetical protein ACI9G1_002189, partial [Pirellulaceae bacterium]
MVISEGDRPHFTAASATRFFTLATLSAIFYLILTAAKALSLSLCSVSASTSDIR